MPASTIKAYWLARFQKRIGKFSKKNPFLQGGQSKSIESAYQINVDKRWAAKSFLNALDAFYVEQRVRHFIGAGLACYATYSKPRSPFLDSKWIESVSLLSRSWKRSSLYHSESIKKLTPSLSEFRYNTMSNGDIGKSHNIFTNLAKSKELKELLLDSPHLSQWVEKKDLLSILNDTSCNQMEERAFWTTLHFSAEAIILRN